MRLNCSGSVGRDEVVVGCGGTVAGDAGSRFDKIELAEPAHGDVLVILLGEVGRHPRLSGVDERAFPGDGDRLGNCRNFERDVPLQGTAYRHPEVFFIVGAEAGQADLQAVGSGRQVGEAELPLRVGRLGPGTPGKSVRAKGRRCSWKDRSGFIMSGSDDGAGDDLRSGRGCHEKQSATCHDTGDESVL